MLIENTNICRVRDIVRFIQKKLNSNAQSKCGILWRTKKLILETMGISNDDLKSITNGGI